MAEQAGNGQTVDRSSRCSHSPFDEERSTSDAARHVAKKTFRVRATIITSMRERHGAHVNALYNAAVAAFALFLAQVGRQLCRGLQPTAGDAARHAREGLADAPTGVVLVELQRCALGGRHLGVHVREHQPRLRPARMATEKRAIVSHKYCGHTR